MGIKYQCKNKNCNYPGSTEFQMEFNSELVMDNKNIAATFCPFCKAEMVSDLKLKDASIPSEARTDK